VLDWRARTVDLPYRDVPPPRTGEVERILGASPGPKWDAERARVDPKRFHAASTRGIAHCRARWPEFPYEIQVLRIGDAAVVGLPGEPFVEGQLELKIGSPAERVQVAHMCTHYVGYIPTEEAAARGGHETNNLYTYWAKMAPDSLDRIVAEAAAMVTDLFADP
jgi:hypothetical protein